MNTKQSQNPFWVAASSSIFALGLAAASPALADGHAEAGNTASHTGHKPRPAMSAKDLITMPRLGSPIVSPDGKRAIYRVTQTDNETFARTPKYYVMDLEQDEAPAFPLRVEIDGAHSLQWVGTNHIYFIATQKNDASAEFISDTQIYIARVREDGAVEDTILASTFKVAPAGFKVSPDEGKVAVWAKVPRTCINLRCDVEAQQKPSAGSGRLYDNDEGFARHWDKWKTPGEFNRVFVHTITDDIIAADSGIPIDGLDPKTGITGNTPSMPFGGGEDIAWAPNSSGVFFKARIADKNEPISTDLDIYWSDLSGSAPEELTAANPAYDTAPTPSPDGKTLAYLAMKRAGYESDRLSIYLRDIKSGKTRELTPDFDRSFGSLSWTKDGQSLLATATDVLDTPVFKINAKTGAIQKLDLMAGYEAHIGNVTPLSGGDILFTRDSIGAPHELFLSKAGAQATPLTDAAMSHLDGRAATITTRFSFAGAGGDEVWGQITKLENHDGKMPAILYIHGGPQGSFRDGWSSRWNPRVLASQGYAVISVDFHGSTGYGQDFTDSINQDWGGKPLEDLQKGLDAALRSDGQIDGTRACAMGASYGGYMVNWIAGKWPDRFQCLIQHDGLFDMRSFYYATEELWFPRWDFGGSYAEVPENYEKWNPVNHVDNWKTPMLVITGEKDFRVPYTQGIQSFTALQERGIPSQLLVFPDENHWVLGAKNSLQWHNTVFDWLDRWLVQDGKKVSEVP